MVGEEQRMDLVMPSPQQDQADIFWQSEMRRTTKELITDETADEKLEGFPLWGMNTKTTKLTFLDDQDVRMLENLFEASVCKYMRSLPPCVTNEDVFMLIDQARIIALMNLRRAKGTSNREKINERTALVSQIRQNISSGGGRSQGQSRGFLGKMFGMR